jgi:hypothetical protein
MNKINRVIILITVFLITSNAHAQLIATKQIFSVNSKAELDFKGIGMNKILFYTSGEIYLKRMVDKVDTVFAKSHSGKVVFENGKAFAYVQITNSATGLCVSSSEDKFEIKFRTDSTKFLTFMKKKGKSDEVALYYFVVPKSKKINYGGYSWEVIYGNGVHLYWKPKDKGRNKKSKEKVKGLKMDGTEKKSLKDRFSKKG